MPGGEIVAVRRHTLAVAVFTLLRMNRLPFLTALLSFAMCISPGHAGEPRAFHFAHRGGAHEFEENTLHAFRSSYREGIRGFETDVRMTRDGKLVILHDDSLDRTHHGSGAVERMDTADLEDIRSRVENEPLLFLDTLLDFLADKPGLYIEFEMKTRNEDLYPDARIEDFARRIHEQVTARQPEGSTWVFTSFDPRPLRALKKIDPRAEIMLIHGGPLDDALMSRAREIGSRRIACRMEGTTRLAVAKAHASGFTITGWPGHTLDDYFLGLGLGVDAICSDVPVAWQRFIEESAMP